jgi:PadR family transcriptional regulator, regulatory protein AphA
MSLEYAILGFLSYQPMSGYELKKMFDQSVKNFWSADQSQIYRTLARLAEEGYAIMQVVEQSERPDRKEYSITPKGEIALRDWLAGPFPKGDARNPILLQTFFSGKCTDVEILTRFEDAARQLTSMLALYEKVPDIIEIFNQQIPSKRESFFWGLTLEWGIRTGKANLEWVESVIERIKQKQVPQS